MMEGWKKVRRKVICETPTQHLLTNLRKLITLLVVDNVH
jgi:hypothetical protein